MTDINKGVNANTVGVVAAKVDTLNQTFTSPQAAVPKKLTTSIPTFPLDDIIGRDDELESLHQQLTDGHSMLLVNGMGGVGKTCLAQAYVSKYWDDYSHIAWVTQSTEDGLSDLVSSPGLLENLSIASQGKDVKELFISVMNAMGQLKNAPNLLIIDNAEEQLGAWQAYLPDPSKWHILLTSRDNIEGFVAQELAFLSPLLALKLFKRHYRRGQLNDSDVEQLLEGVDFHTLTIEILAKVAHKQRLSIGQLNQVIKADLEANIDTKHSGVGSNVSRVRSYLTAIFAIDNLSDAECWLMKQLMCLPPEFHSYDRLNDLIQVSSSDYELNLSASLERLSQRGWLIANEGSNSYKMHNVISDALYSPLKLEIQDIQSLFELVIDKLLIDQAKDNPVDKFKWIPFGERLLSLFADHTLPDVARLQNNLATVLQALGDYEGAKGLLEKALTSDEQNFGEDHPTTADRYSNLASVLKALGDYEGAKVLLKKALTSDEQNFGEDHPSMARCNSNLALVLKDLGDYEGAKVLLEKALALAEQHFGEDYPVTATCNSNLALVLQDLGDYEGAKVLLEKVLTHAEKNFGEDHPTTAVSYSNLALVLNDLGDYEGAKVLVEKALRSDEQNFGEEHPTTAARYSNLALILKALGDYEGARVLLEKARMSVEQNFGEDHPTTAVSYSNLASVLNDLGDYEGAKVLLEKALMWTEQRFGEEHPTSAVRFWNLSIVLKDLGDYEAAIVLAGKAYRVFSKALPEGHPYITRSLHTFESIKAAYERSS